MERFPLQYLHAYLSLAQDINSDNPRIRIGITTIVMVCELTRELLLRAIY